MSTQEPGRATGAPGLTALPRVEDLPQIERGYDPDRVRDAFDAYRRHVSQLQAQLRVLQAAGRTAQVEPTGHSVRMDALHLIRAAAEFADTLERDAQKASAAQLARTEAEVRRRQRDLQEREGELERYRLESERQRGEILNAARAESREIVAEANREATQELREAEARAARLLEQSRHQATELTNAARAEVEQTLEWSRAQSNTIVVRAREGAEQLLRAAGLGEPALSQVAEAIVRSAEAAAEPAPTPSSGPVEEAWDAPPPPPPTLAPPPPSDEPAPDEAGEVDAAAAPPDEEGEEGPEGSERRE
jgi:F0F1-type ATP synthase membrane subunit b/b'